MKRIINARKKGRTIICMIGDCGFVINGLHGGSGFALYFGKLFIWQQAWFGETNEVAWWIGKYRFVFPFVNKQYYPIDGWRKL